MGLSSSQGRLLMLTSRLSDIELQEIMISQRQNQLAAQKSSAAEEFNNAMNNYKLTINVTNPNEESGFKQEDLDYTTMTQMGYLATNSDGAIYLKKDEETGEWIIPKNIKGEDLLTINENGKAVLNNKEYDIVDGSAYLSNKNVLQNLIMNSLIFLNNTQTGQENISAGVLESDTQIERVLDTSDDAAAESQYNYDLAQIEAADNKLDMELQALETQHEAVLKEYDSVKEVISNNIDRTFKLFSNG